MLVKDDFEYLLAWTVTRLHVGYINLMRKKRLEKKKASGDIFYRMK